MVSPRQVKETLAEVQREFSPFLIKHLIGLQQRPQKVRVFGAEEVGLNHDITDIPLSKIFLERFEVEACRKVQERTGQTTFRNCQEEVSEGGLTSPLLHFP